MVKVPVCVAPKVGSEPPRGKHSKRGRALPLQSA